MNNILNTIVALVTCLFISSCSQPAPENDLIIEIDLSNPQEKLPLSSFTDGIRSCKLELPDPHFFGIISEIITMDNLLFLVDKKQNKIFTFNQDGKFLYTIGQRGDGPQEYRNISSFFIGENRAFICDIGSRKIYAYGFDGSFIETIAFPYSWKNQPNLTPLYQFNLTPLCQF